MSTISKPVTTYQDGLFQKRHTIKITRTQYGLIIGVGVKAEELKAALAKIPDTAWIIDEEDCDDGKRDVYVFEVEEKGDEK